MESNRLIQLRQAIGVMQRGNMRARRSIWFNPAPASDAIIALRMPTPREGTVRDVALNPSYIREAETATIDTLELARRVQAGRGGKRRGH